MFWKRYIEPRILADTGCNIWLVMASLASRELSRQGCTHIYMVGGGRLAEWGVVYICYPYI